MMDRSAELRAAGGGEPPGPAAALEAVPQLAAGLSQAHLTEAQREQATRDILLAFLEASVNGSSGGPGSKSSWIGAASDGATAPHRTRGLQGQVVEHLIAGGFDEDLLQSVPTHTLNWAIKVLGEQHHPVLAEQLYHWMRVTGRANEHSFVKLCEACGAARQPWRAFHAWRTTRRVPQARHIVGSHAGAALVLAYRSTADHQAALKALEDLRSRRVALTRHAYNAAVRVCADAGAVDDALRLLAALRSAATAEQQGPQRDHRALPAGAAQQGRQAGGRRRLPQPQQEERPLGELRTDCRSYSAALAAVAAACTWNRVPQLHRWMQEDGVVPDAPLATQLLSAYAAGGQASAAQGVFDSLAPAGVRPNRSHWNALLLAYAEAGDGVGCAAAYRAMVSSAIQPDAYTLTALLRAAYVLGAGLPAVQAVQAEASKHAVGTSLRLGTAMLACLRHVRPSTSPAAAALSQLRPARVARKDRRRQRRRQAGGQGDGSFAAAAVLADGPAAAGLPVDASTAAGLPVDAAAAVALAAGPAGHDASAAAAPGSEESVPGPAAGGADQAAQCLAAAAAVFAELRAAAAGGGPPLDVRAYNALLAVQLAAGDHAGVLRTFSQLEDEERGVLPDAGTLAAVITACEEAGWREQEAQYRRLLESSRLLGTLGGRRGSLEGTA